jgi:YbgC/YbaW family acyl-CoA thioester hydrolase
VSVDPLEYRTQWPVRSYELDGNGHVNNAVYLNYAEHLTIEHAERSGFGADWTRENGGAWVVHRNFVTYQRPALYGDMLDLCVRVLLVRGTRGVRHTVIHRLSDAADLAEIVTEWVWTRLADGRPGRVPRTLEDIARPATEATLERNPRFLRQLSWQL